MLLLAGSCSCVLRCAIESTSAPYESSRLGHTEWHGERLCCQKSAEAFREHHVQARAMLQICRRVLDVQMKTRHASQREALRFQVVHPAAHDHQKQNRSKAGRRCKRKTRSTVHRVVGAQLQVPSSAVVPEAQVPTERTDTKTVPCQRPPKSSETFPQRNQNATNTSPRPEQKQKGYCHLWDSNPRRSLY